MYSRYESFITNVIWKLLSHPIIHSIYASLLLMVPVLEMLTYTLTWIISSKPFELSLNVCFFREVTSTLSKIYFFPCLSLCGSLFISLTVLKPYSELMHLFVHCLLA